MQIKFLQNTLGAKDSFGNSVIEYQANEIYDLSDDLAEIFLNANLAEKSNKKQEEKAIDNLENKSIEPNKKKNSPKN